MRHALLLFVLLPPASLAQITPVPFFPPDLAQYLRLTQAQAQQIARNHALYLASQTSAFERIQTLNGEIGDETRKPSPDAPALGARYQEIENLCRQNEEPLRQLNQQQLRLLTDEQRMLLRGLEDDSRLQSLSFLAEALLMIPPRSNSPEGFPTAFNGTPFRGPTAGRFFDATPLGTAIPAEMVVYLGLTQPQYERLQRGYRAYQDFYTARVGRMAEVNAELQAEFAGQAPSAVELGSRYWELEAQRRQIAEREAATRREIGAVLSAAQAARLAELNRPVRSFFLGTLAQQFNLLLPPAVTSRPASRPSSVTVRVVFPGGTGGSNISGLLGAADSSAIYSIYRTCHAGPDYEYRVELANRPTIP